MTGVQIYAPLTNICGTWGQVTVRKSLHKLRKKAKVDADPFSIVWGQKSPENDQDLHSVQLIFTTD